MSAPSTMDAVEMQLGAELEAVLSETPLEAGRREANAFDALRNGRDIVIFGAGHLGQRILAALRGSGIEPLAFSDNDPRLWKTQVHGVEVLAPDVAAQNYGSHATFLIAIWHPSRISSISSVRRQLTEAGCLHIVAFPVALWKYSHSLLPYYLWDLPSKLLAQREIVLSAFQLLHDDASKLEFVRQIRLRILADFDSLPGLAAGAQYFPAELVVPRPDECFVDCGAYNGDTLSDFVAYYRGKFASVVAFEPDPVNFASLQDKVEREPALLGRTALHNAAVGAASRTVQFNANGLASASVCNANGVSIGCLALDDVLCDARPTFIKMDIEGAELEALAGAGECIQKYRPLLAVCSYHKQDHLWTIPLAIDELLPNCRIFLRSHCADGLDVVCYAIPAGRSVRG